ncbi:hypothetical protein H4Q26_003425 [Puccinia striiformis f. sp. tritici PST-130]|nr:hypothetical protein H4Q26_003425 [Puccinia striiformis f. sp. tritici PST-130]
MSIVLSELSAQSQDMTAEFPEQQRNRHQIVRFLVLCADDCDKRASDKSIQAVDIEAQGRVQPLDGE